MLQLSVIGNVGQDAHVSNDNNLTSIRFSVASNFKTKNIEGVEVENTTWINCTIFRQQGQSVKIAEFLKAGKKVFCQGRPNLNTWKDKDNNFKAGINLIVDKFELLSPAESSEPQETQTNENPDY